MVSVVGCKTGHDQSLVELAEGFDLTPVEAISGPVGFPADVGIRWFPREPGVSSGGEFGKSCSSRRIIPRYYVGSWREGEAQGQLIWFSVAVHIVDLKRERFALAIGEGTIERIEIRHSSKNVRKGEDKGMVGKGVGKWV